MRLICLTALFILIGATAYSAPEGWVAYNDCVFKDAQFIGENVTTFGIGRTNIYPESGNLINQVTGKDTGVVVTFSEFITAGSVNWAGDAAQFDKGSDADEIFGGYVDPSGNISYGDAPGWYVDLTIEKLDPEGYYTFAGTVNRNGDGADYTNRVTNWRLIGADSFIYASSEKAQKVDEDTVEFVTGDNDVGYVAKWVNIDPGKDGEIVIRTTHGVGKEGGGIAGANEYKGYAGGMFMLEFQGPQAVSASGKLTSKWSEIKSVR